MEKTTKTYTEMYQEAIEKIGNDAYKGYYRANAYSLYVYEKFNVNAAASNLAHDALCEAITN